jgi:uncharacterized protein YxeA
LKNILLIIVPLVLTIILGVFIQNILHKDADKMSQELYKLNEAVNNNNWKAASDQMKKSTQYGNRSALNGKHSSIIWKWIGSMSPLQELGP